MRVWSFEWSLGFELPKKSLLGVSIWGGFVRPIIRGPKRRPESIEAKGVGMHLNTYLQFNGNCEAAFEFYEQCLGGKIEAITPYA
jgi:hypothetical protein